MTVFVASYSVATSIFEELVNALLTVSSVGALRSGNYLSSNMNAEKHCSVVLYYDASLLCNRGQAVAQLVGALRYKPEGRGFDSRRCHWNF
jgi:hypothetical protein